MYLHVTVKQSIYEKVYVSKDYFTNRSIYWLGGGLFIQSVLFTSSQLQNSFKFNNKK